MAKYAVKIANKDIYLSSNEAALWTDNLAEVKVFTAKAAATSAGEATAQKFEVVTPPAAPAEEAPAEEAPAEEG